VSLTFLHIGLSISLDVSTLGYKYILH